MTDWKQEALQSLLEQRRRPGGSPPLDLCEEDLVQEGFAQDFVQAYQPGEKRSFFERVKGSIF